MFHTKKKWQQYLLLGLFGAISLGIIVATAILLFSLFQKNSSPTSDQKNIRGQNSVENSSLGVDTVSPETLAKLAEDYGASLVTLQKDLHDKRNSLSAASFKETAVGALMDMRVPKEMRDAHLRAVLGIQELNGDDEKIKDLLLSIIDTLVTEVKNIP